MNIQKVIGIEYVKKPCRSVSCDVYEMHREESEGIVQGRRVPLTRVTDVTISIMAGFEDRIIKLESRVSELESIVNVLTCRIRALE